MNKKVNIGFIGAGAFANQMHYPSVTEMSNVELVCICDLNPEKLNETADRYGIEKRYDSYRKMLSDEELDAVYIIMPPMGVKQIAIDCLNAGKHIFIEKPPGLSSSDVSEMAKAAVKNGCKTMAGFNRRFAPLTLETRKIIEQYGQIVHVLIQYNKATYKLGPIYNISNILMDTVHQFDLLRWLNGDVKKVLAIKRCYECSAVNILAMGVEHENGATSCLSVNYTSGARIERLEIHGNGIGAYMNVPYECSVYGPEPKGSFYMPEPNMLLRASEFTNTEDIRVNLGYVNESRHFIDCILEDRQPITNFEDSIKTMQFVEQALEGLK